MDDGWWARRTSAHGGCLRQRVVGWGREMGRRRSGDGQQRWGRGSGARGMKWIARGSRAYWGARGRRTARRTSASAAAAAALVAAVALVAVAAAKPAAFVVVAVVVVVAAAAPGAAELGARRGKNCCRLRQSPGRPCSQRRGKFQGARSGSRSRRRRKRPRPSHCSHCAPPSRRGEHRGAAPPDQEPPRCCKDPPRALIMIAMNIF